MSTMKAMFFAQLIHAYDSKFCHICRGSLEYFPIKSKKQKNVKKHVKLMMYLLEINLLINNINFNKIIVRIVKNGVLFTAFQDINFTIPIIYIII